ncbi:hypothetical protein [Aquibacillus sediminis]|uniref:hypothetical protein n=1 Tax=Aquibacillus sediminis TaxID=2574734 RepID=UPI001109CC31|nr:hypothetical protein [Aquibacillus sediminis]
MGYVLPIPSYQYQDYHTRISKTKSDPFPIGKLSKAQLDETYLQYRTPQKNQTMKKLHLSKNYHQLTIDHVYAQLTGIGKNINERV